MLVAPAARRRAPRPHPRDRPRPACRCAITGNATSWSSDAPRRLALAPDRESRRANMTGRAGCRRWKRPRRSGCRSSGTCSTTARPITSIRPAPDFAERFTDFALAALEVQRIGQRPAASVCPLNEINFLSWAVDDGYFPPVGPDERGWFKRQLVRAGDHAAARAIKRALAGIDHRLGRAADPHRAARPAPARRSRAAEQNLSGHVRSL